MLTQCKKLFRSSLLLASPLLLTACALSPQYVEISPKIEVKERIMPAQVVQLSIEDNRTQQHIGTRGGVYKETSYIYLDKPVSKSLRPVAIAALQELGLDPNGVSPQPVLMNIRLDQLSYVMSDESLPKKVDLTASLHLSASKGDKNHEGRFNSAKQFSFFSAPDEEDNTEMINEILSDTLTRLFNDPKFIQFIRE